MYSSFPANSDSEVLGFLWNFFPQKIEIKILMCFFEAGIFSGLQGLLLSGDLGHCPQVTWCMTAVCSGRMHLEALVPDITAQVGQRASFGIY